MRSIKKQLGMSLVELIIAGALGVGLTTAIINIVVVSNRTSSQSDGISQAQETGRFVASFLGDALASAGYSGDSANTFIDPHADLCANPAQGSCTIDTQNGTGDRITVRRLITEEDDRDCTGSSLNIAAGVEDQVIDAFWVEVNDDGDSELRCLTYRARDNWTYDRAAQPIATGVAAIHALYGHSSARVPNGNRNVTRYLAPADIPLDPDTGDREWQFVFSVKIAILVQSFDESSIQDKERAYILLDADPYRMTDRFSREVFTTTVTRANFNNLP